MTRLTYRNSEFHVHRTGISRLNPRSYRLTLIVAGAWTAGCALDEGTGKVLGEGTVWDGVHAANARIANTASRSTTLLTRDRCGGSADLTRHRRLFDLLLMGGDHLLRNV